MQEKSDIRDAGNNSFSAFADENNEHAHLMSFSIYNSSDAAFWTDSSGKLFYVNRAASSLLKYTEQELLQMTVLDIDPRFTQEIWVKHWEEVKERHSFLFESFLLDKYGEKHSVEITVNYLNFEGKEYNCAFIRDIKERKKIERGLKLACLSLENCIDLVAWIKDNGELFYLNKAGYDLLEYSPEEKPLLTVHQVAPFYTPQMWKKIWNEVKSNKKYYAEISVHTKNGNMIPVSISSTFLIYESREYICFFARNITEKKKYENAILESRGQLRTLVNTLPDLVWLKDVNGVFLACNSRFERLYCAKEENIIGKTDYDFVDRQLADFFNIKDQEAIRAGRPLIFEEEVTYADDGHKEYLETIKSPVYDANRRLIGVLGVGRDVTERKKEKEQILEAKITAEEASRTKDEFLATMSHELRTPLNSILGFSDILLSESFGPVNETQAEYISYISSGGKHLLKIINDILDLSKAQAGKMQLEYEPFFISELIEDVENMLAPFARKKNIQLAVTIQCDTGSIIADKTKFKQILYNIVSNAIKFTPDKGKVSIEVTKPDNFIVISVEDTGIGILQQDLEKIFHPFKQLNHYMNHEYRGTGLGLAITRKFIELHGGSIIVISEPGKGSTFIFSVPAAPILNK